ncbi:MAG TPA: 50S ribosomal protein L10 [Candidatus Pacearchaeota archaeon]|nr:50S ribosomal protein L10 [Candidatus Pacearchaeota archaeon]
MPLTLEQKKKIVADLADNLSRQQGIVLVDFSQLPADELAEFRQQLRANDCLLQAAKKSLVARALAESKIMEEFSLDGPVALVFGFSSIITPAKISYQFAKKNERLKIIGGIWENELQDQAAVMALAQLPSHQELLARFARTLKSPISGLVNVCQGNFRNLVMVLSEIQKIKN